MRLVRCNRCGAEQETPTPPTHQIFPVVPSDQAQGWTRMGVFQKAAMEGVEGSRLYFDLCEDCRGVLLEQFMKGAAVAAITQPQGKNRFPHDDMLFQDCLLAFDPERGGLICEHDDPERFLKLQRDRVQNVAEGVPEQLAQQIQQVAADVQTAGYAHSVPQRCGFECTEQHTYVTGCILAGVVQPPDRPYGVCPYCSCTDHRGLRCSSTGCNCQVSTAGEDLTAAYSEQDPVQEGE